jgi:hypothetical protein
MASGRVWVSPGTLAAKVMMAPNSPRQAAKPTIAAAANYSDDTLTGWTTALAAGDVIRFNLDSTSTFTRISVFLIVE